MSDTRSPSLSSFNFSTQTVDLSLDDAEIRFHASAIDDLSGIANLHGLWRSPSREQTLSLSVNPNFDIVSGTKFNGTWRSAPSGNENWRSEPFVSNSQN